MPSTIEHEGKTYTVTSLNGNCFYNCTNIEKITLPSTITTIGINCFLNCSNLKSLILTSTTPPTCKGIIGINNNVNIGVPSELISAYESDDYWKLYYIGDMLDLPGDIITTDDNLKLQLYPQSQTATLLRNDYDRSGTFTIPETITYEGVTFTITALDNECFFMCSNITNISLPSFLKTIGNSCFYYCSALTTINIPEGVTSIGDKCFYDCSALTTINIPEGVTSLGEQCFRSCDKLFFIEIPESVKSIGSNCFVHCTILKGNGIVINSTTPPNLLDDIYVKNIYVPEEAVETYKANESWKDKTIYQMDDFHFADIEVNGFKYDIYHYKGEATLKGNNYSSETLEIPESVTYQGKTYTVKELGNSCFHYCVNLQSVLLPNTIRKIGDECFYGCSALTTINIPESVTSLGDECFYGCSALTTINIPEGVTSIGDNCFTGCSALESIVIPKSVTSLGNYCFRSCDKLLFIEIPESVKSIGSNCFLHCI